MPWFGSRSSGKVDKPAVLSEIQRQIPAILQINSQRQNWPATPTGISGNASAARRKDVYPCHPTKSLEVQSAWAY